MAEQPRPAREPGHDGDAQAGGHRGRPFKRVAPARRPATSSIAGGQSTATVSLADSAPFAWQDGVRLFLLDGGAHGWVLAELRFDSAACHYVEIRRAQYRWAGEAAGAFLSRVLASGRESAERASRALAAWLAATGNPVPGAAIDRTIR